MTTIPQTAVAVPLELLKSKTITVLVDSFQAAFTATYDEERGLKEQARRRLLAELRGPNEFANSTAHEEYRPS
ncbi:hypothetical protein F7R91_01620 [Streptomyces luteolifulvus]|uniref:Uncharacterized protein n=1 Tax=Streptomyces luteolifulvus TaxID=2615112 RepID=A0A6H9V8G3_9ACTN|nr:hypothetical protein [Streptomyces luteolifulvus]KAB1150704.1 hypothetical protein F7R91_01620 [Streptomyces luteolifulvus]